MDVGEICSRASGSEYTEEELSFVVEQHILNVKNRRVKINIKKVLMVGGDLAGLLYSNQLKKLIAAFNISETYFKNR